VIRNQPKRLVALVAAAILLFTACSNSPSPSASGTGGLKLVTPGKLTIGYFPSFPVTDVKDGKGIGTNGLLMQEVADTLGLQAVWVPYAFAALIPALQSHRIDTLAAGFSITQPRSQILYYGPPFTFGVETLIVKPGTQVSSWEEAAQKGLTLATVKGFFQLGEWEQLGIKSHAFDSTDACVQDVVSGGATGCAIGSFEIVYRKATDPTSPAATLTQVVMNGPRILADLNSFAVAQDNPGLANAVSGAITTLWRNGGVDTAYKSVFKGTDYSIFLNPEPGQAMYLPGPWEVGTTPPAPETYPKVTPISSGNLTVGIVNDSPLLKLTGTTFSGPEAAALSFVAGKLGLTLKGVRVTDEAGALNNGTVDVLAGQLATTADRTRQYWMTGPVAFSPDYIYVKPDKDGAFPSYTSWEDVKKANGKLAVISGDPRLADLATAGIDVVTVDSAAAGLKAVVDGTAAGFVGRSTDYTTAASADPSISGAGIGWVRNSNLYTKGEAYAWGVKSGNGALVDALNQGITAAWQQHVIGDAFSAAWPAANVTAVEAPGPAAIGTSFSTSKDYRITGMFVSGPWLQRPANP
jgi:ABC-type amino acid transport substrate-binding protein